MLVAPFLVLTFSSLMNLSSTLKANASCLLIRPLLSLTALIPPWLLQVCHCIHITNTLTFSIIFQNYSLHDLTPLSMSMVWHIVAHGPPVHARARRLNPEKLTAAKAEFLKMEEMGIIRRSNSPWSSPLHVVPKAGGQLRPCGDYRHLNAATKDDRYPLPHIQDFNNILTGCKIFSKIDPVRGYHQIPMASSSVAKTAIITPFGLWEFLRMPFGLKNAAKAFQRLMDGILRDVPFTFVYIDDILVANHSHEEHLEHLRQLFGLLSSNGLVINKTKCVFGVPELDFLGHRVTAQGIRPLPDRVAALQDCIPPTDRTSLQRFLGMMNYYPRFIPHVPSILTPWVWVLLVLLSVGGGIVRLCHLPVDGKPWLCELQCPKVYCTQSRALRWTAFLDQR